jgi:S1-C subfamily serine protease
VLVSGVAAGSPAARAGLRRGDVITSINHVHVTDAGHLRNVIALAGPHQISIEYMRGGKRTATIALLIEAPPEADDTEPANASSDAE